MRIAYVYDRLYPFSKGGVEKRIADLSRHLTARGHEIHLYGIKAWEGPSLYESDYGILVGVKGKVADSLPRSVISRLVFGVRLARQLWNTRYDIVDVQSISPLACLSAAVVCRLRRTAFVVTWHEVWLKYWFEYLGALGTFGRLADRLIVVLGNHHVAVSGHTANRLLHLGVTADEVLPNGVDLAHFSTLPDSSERAGILYVGRFAPHKNLVLLLSALRRLRSRGINAQATIVGDGPLRAAIAREAGSINNCEIMGPLGSHDQVVHLMKNSRVFALPSAREGFGLAALEALASGTPVVTTSHEMNAMTDLVEDNVNGLITEPDEAALADALERILTDEHLHQRLSAGARSSASRFDLEMTSEAIERYYLQIGTRGQLSDESR